MKFQGKVSNWNDDKGYGFVEPNGGGERSFVHIKSFRSNTRRPVNGDVIVYEQQKDKDGRYKAGNINFSKDLNNQKMSMPRSKKIGGIVTITFGVILFLVTILGKLAPVIAGIYVAVSLVTFLMYASDKSAAQNGRWRTKERSLHLAALMGGWPGAYYAQNKLRHKSSKTEFLNIFWLTVAINIAAFIWMFTAEGSLFVESISAIFKR